VLAAGILVGGMHMAASRALRGSSMPVDLVVYTTVLTLVVFMLFPASRRLAQDRIRAR
jgi:hypothetical protein